MDGSDEFLVPSADIDRACPGDRPYMSLYLSCWLASIDLDLNLDLLNRVLIAPKKSRFFFLLRPRSPGKHSETIRIWGKRNSTYCHPVWSFRVSTSPTELCGTEISNQLYKQLLEYNISFVGVS